LTWRDHLRLKLNERGFHEQFKPTKLLGEGSFAKVFKVQNIENQMYYAAKSFSKQEVYQKE
jgi:serine/threonine protein kinase